MKKSRLFLSIIALFGVYLMFSAPVFAGNVFVTDNAKKTSEYVCNRVNLIERKIVFESTKQLLSELNSTFDVLKEAEIGISPEDKKQIFESFRKVIEGMFALKKDCQTELGRLYDDVWLFCNSGRPKTPPVPEIFCAPKLKPQAFYMNISAGSLPPLLDAKCLEALGL